ncbi:hypothetical protein DFH28DRAFT_1217530 [Melampsora americana]|nr:hypothetical protein DFH28DRAFT_1217530 [Melampsora americana]
MSEVPKLKTKKRKKQSASEKKRSSDSEPPSDSLSLLSDDTLLEDESLDGSSEIEKAELDHAITDFQLAKLPELPDNWDKGFRKLTADIPLILLRTSLLESYHDEDFDQKVKDKSDISKTSLKLLEKQLTYGDFINMCNLEEHYTREIYGLDPYTDYVVKHKSIVT